jgi:hypothetical protein
MEEKYFVLTDLGYYGIAINVYTTEKEAKEILESHKEDMDKLINDFNREDLDEPLIIIKGTIIQNYNWKEKYL